MDKKDDGLHDLCIRILENIERDIPDRIDFVVMIVGDRRSQAPFLTGLAAGDSSKEAKTVFVSLLKKIEALLNQGTGRLMDFEIKKVKLFQDDKGKKWN